MAERKAVNKYYPPEWTPGHGSINKFRNSHPLRDRARKLHLGILVIRFEMPYNIWCDGCGNHIGTGVRYNAEKSKVGMYYSTPIYKFRMKCHLCDNHFEIKTDPQNMDYEIISGARRQERRWDPTENEQVAPDDKEVSKKMATDAMFKLEHDVDDKGKVKVITPSLARLEHLQDRWRDDYTANQLLRKSFGFGKAPFRNLYRLFTPFAASDERQKQKRKEIAVRPLFASQAPKSTSTEQPPKVDSLNVTKFEMLDLEPRMSASLQKDIVRKREQEKEKASQSSKSPLSEQIVSLVSDAYFDNSSDDEA
ncbi:hypothetical protein HPB50_004074 [Hyalomma asiaticum]|uniref:Uncharacterized protein n=1 Tax=Hyalomma asiaticum TaxID=266040 RepID=A0ACB7T160_HYAAI|nr:hypothetical protein HPB50_004074 [Hyalomma asiaticum]